MNQVSEHRHLVIAEITPQMNSWALTSPAETEKQVQFQPQSSLSKSSWIWSHETTDHLMDFAFVALSFILYFIFRRMKRAHQRAQDLTNFNHALEQKVQERTQELKQFENKFKNTFEKAAVGMSHVGLDGRWLQVNPRLCEITGYTESELLQKTFADITHPDDLDKDWQQAHALIRGDISSYEMQKRYFRKDGSLIWIKLSTALSRNAEGQPEYFISCVSDITPEHTARVQAEIEKAKMSRFFDQVPTPIAIYEGPDHRITLANPEYRRQTGYENIVGLTYAEAFPSSVEQGLPQLLTEVFKTGKPWSASEFPIRLNFPDGTSHERYINATLQPYRNAKGEVEGLINLSYDVTEQVLARHRLEESEQRLQIAVRAADMGVWEWDVSTGKVQWDQHMTELFGGPTSKFGGTLEDYTNRIHPEDRHRVDSIIQSILQTETEFEVEHRVIRDDGSIHWVLVRGGSVFNEMGQALKVLGVALDIGLRKEAIESIRSSEERFRTLFEQSPLSIEIHAPNGALEKVNRAWTKLWNIPEENIPEIIRTYNVLEDKQLESKGILSYIREGFAGKYTKTPPTFYDPNEVGVEGRVRWVETYITPVKNNDGSLREVVIIHEDISERKAAEEALRHSKEAAEAANIAKTQFLANMSHEIRTPLGAMLGFAELMLEEDTSKEEQRKNLQTIVRNGKQLYKLIDELLDISKVEANKIEIEKSKFDLEEAVQDVASLLSVKAEQKGIEFLVKSEDLLPEFILTDSVRFKQILTNVIGNAIKFTDKGKVDVTLRLRHPKVNNDSSYLEITVEDTGVGIPEPKLEKLFQPFVQADTATTRKFGGTGLGLYLSRKLAQALGGDIQLLRCQESQGCTFQISIDIGHLEKRPTFTLNNRAGSHKVKGDYVKATTGRLDDIHVLVIDDLKDNLDLTKMFLTAAGAKVQTALGAQEAFVLLDQHEFGVIVMDIQMPHMDGYEATQKLRSMGYRKPIVALTAHAMKGEKERCLKAGFDGFLNKPINRKDLVQEIKLQADRPIS